MKSQIKTCLLKTLTSLVSDARSTASQVIAKVADFELPQKQWPELIGSLLSNIHQLPAHVKQATLETLGYLCEEVSPDVLDQGHVNKVLTAVVQGMRQEAFECLVSISSTYYEKLAPSMQQIYNITAKAVREDEDPVALQAIEFWSSICDEEIDILEEYGGDFTADSDISCFYFIKQALVPMLLETLLEQDEDLDQDEGARNIAVAGGTCLGLVARAVGDEIAPLVTPFVEENITKSDWRQREAATYAFGSILEGPSPDKLLRIANVALSFILNTLTKDPKAM